MWIMPILSVTMPMVMIVVIALFTHSAQLYASSRIKNGQIGI
jgi:hypothetical protein